MKKARMFLLALLSLCALCLGLGSCKKSSIGADGLKYTLTEDGEGYVVSAVDAVTVADLVIPATYKEKPVLEIKGFAFEEQEGITSVTVPASVKVIGAHAFYGCGSLETIHFAENSALASIGSYAFAECHGLSALTIPASLEEMGRGAFQRCSSLQTVTFEEEGRLEVVGDYAFFECRGLENVTFATEGVLTYIDENAFLGCESLTSVTIPASVEEIGRHAFYKCTALEEIRFEEESGLTAIWDEAFAYCESLSSLTLPNRKVDLYRGAFSYCKGLTDVTVPHENSYLYHAVFRGCESLETLTLPFVGAGKWASWSGALLGYHFGTYKMNDLGVYDMEENLNDYVPDSLKTVVITCDTHVSRRAFTQCHSITEIHLPSSITWIGGDAFRECESLVAIHFGGTMEEWNAIGKENFWNSKTGEYTVYCADGNLTK